MRMRMGMASKISGTFVCMAMFAAAMTGGSAGASAADLFVPPPAEEAVVPAPPMDAPYDWSGVYLGGHAGWGWMDAKVRNETVGTHKLDADSVVGGVLGGVSFQSGNVVYGLEGDVTWGSLSSPDKIVCETPCTPALEESFRVGPIGTIRGRVGYAADRTLFFVTAGLGIADARATLRRDPDSTRDSRVHYGFVVGAGIEYAVTDTVLLRGEYLYGNYGKKTYRWPNAANRRIDFETNTVRAAVSFKLDPFLF